MSNAIPQKVIDIALAEVGYLEKATYDQLDDPTANAGKLNYTKYARDLAKYPFYNGSKKGVAWCDVFVDWCFVQAYGVDAARALTYQSTNAAKNYGAGCRYSRNYFKSKGRLFDSPEPGDQIFFYSKDKKSISHTGLVYKVDSKKVYTVEGNTSGASGVISNGGGVCKKSYSLTYGRLAGFGRPEWDAEAPVVAPAEKVEETPAQEPQKPAQEPAKAQGGVNMPTLREGDKGTAVRILQRMLIMRGCHLPRYGCDAHYGEETKAAVKAYQKTHALNPDGICGPLTWAALAG